LRSSCSHGFAVAMSLWLRFIRVARRRLNGIGRLT
jgi:hypothetical protein